MDADLSIIRRLAVGGTAEIVLVRRSNGQLAVLKRLLDSVPESVVAGLHREAEILGGISSPSVVKLLRASERSLLLEYVEGVDAGSLSQRLAKRGQSLSAGAAIAVGTGVARALTLVHGLGFVHADVAPANVLLGRDGAVKVCDLGMARRMGASGPTAPEGTLAYQSPEQLALGPIDGTSDVYAAGLILYELLTGTAARPSGQLGLAELRSARTVLPTRPSTVRPGLLPEFDDLIMDVLAPDPSVRPSALQWLHRLQSTAVTSDPGSLARLVSGVLRAPIPAVRTSAAPAESTALLDPRSERRAQQISSGPRPRRQNLASASAVAPAPSDDATMPGRPWPEAAGCGSTNGNRVPPAVTEPDLSPPQLAVDETKVSSPSGERDPFSQVIDLTDSSSKYGPTTQPDVEQTPLFVHTPAPRIREHRSMLAAGIALVAALVAALAVWQRQPSAVVARQVEAEEAVTAPTATPLAPPVQSPRGERDERGRANRFPSGISVGQSRSGISVDQSRSGISVGQSRAGISVGQSRAGISVGQSPSGISAPSPTVRRSVGTSATIAQPRSRRRKTAAQQRLTIEAPPSVRIRGVDIDGVAPQTLSMSSGVSLIRLNRGAMMVTLRLQTSEGELHVTVGAPAGTYYGIRCGDRPRRWTPLVDVPVKRVMQCTVSDREAELSFSLRRASD